MLRQQQQRQQYNDNNSYEAIDNTGDVILTNTHTHPHICVLLLRTAMCSKWVYTYTSIYTTNSSKKTVSRVISVRSRFDGTASVAPSFHHKQSFVYTYSTNAFQSRSVLCIFFCVRSSHHIKYTFAHIFAHTFIRMHKHALTRNIV